MILPMARIIHENRSATTDSPFITDTAFVLRNEDDTPHSLDVRVVDEDGVLAESRHTVAGDSQRAIAAGTDEGTLRVDLRADHGASASLVVDDRCPAPEFVVRRETIVVAGLH